MIQDGEGEEKEGKKRRGGGEAWSEKEANWEGSKQCHFCRFKIGLTKPTPYFV